MAEKKDAKDTKKKTKRPTAEKRVLRNEKHRVINKAFKSQARSTIRAFEEAVVAGNPEQIQSQLAQVYSVMDKGVKRGVFKLNQASRTKLRACKKTSSVKG